jgi:oligoribonuclease NrnB/cAMP/cGMP phosphodiesterase (DHH superfamily)
MTPSSIESDMSPPAVVVISHGEDADGITCAALIRRMKAARPILVNYDDLKDAIRSIQPPLEELYMCDLNVRDDLVEEILRITGFARVTLIDHHPTTPGILERLEEAGAEVVHDPRDCASVLLYNRFRDELGREAGRMAAYAAWADQFEDGPIAEVLLREYDRQSVQHEGLLLAHALPQRPTKEFRGRVLEALSRLEPPHRVPGVPEAAIDHLEKTATLIETLTGKAERLQVIAYMKADEGTSIGSVAGLITDAMGTQVGVCYKLKGDLINISLRSRRGLPYHLGEITRQIATGLGGFGGGHKRASGASIPGEALERFLSEMDETLASHK